MRLFVVQDMLYEACSTSCAAWRTVPRLLTHYIHLFGRINTSLLTVDRSLLTFHVMQDTLNGSCCVEDSIAAFDA